MRIKDMQQTVHPVILAGGSGTRLWPMSRTEYPKQFLSLAGNKSLLQQTALRVAGTEKISPPLVIANENQRFIVAEQLHQIGVEPQVLLLEPTGRNTAPAVCIAALWLMRQDATATMLVMPSDHSIEDPRAFLVGIEHALAAARAGRFVTFGITPTRAETGYGYIQRGKPLKGVQGAYAIARFVEKPNTETAETYIAAGDFFWNSGIFLISAALYLSELERLQPEMLGACRAALDSAKYQEDSVRLDRDNFSNCPAASIDYVPVKMGWSDLGSWTTLWDASEKDANGNALIGDVIGEDTKNCYLRSESGLIAALGVEDLIVVAMQDAVMLAPRGRERDVQQLVKRLAVESRNEAVVTPRVYRPWGSYETLHAGHRVQVKLIIVKPGGKLSLQMHHHRAEHWVIVQGTALVRRGDDEVVLTENQSTYISLGQHHRLENPGKIPLHVIEVQSGPYLDEDDIVRFDDTYGRG
jgi:mannose-1-phosphate guanylyltransferase/mannose-6-phosphate isomerase